MSRRQNPALLYLQDSIGQTAEERCLSHFGLWLDFRLTHAEFGHVIAEFQVREEQTNPVGMLHGGVIAAMLDEVMGMATMSLGRPTFLSTINLSIDYHTFAKAGDTLSVEAVALRPGPTVVNLTGTVKRGEKLIASATSNTISSGKDVDWTSLTPISNRTCE